MANLMKIRNANHWELTRRAFLGRSGAGMGILALASLLKPELLEGAEGGVASKTATDRWSGVVHPLDFPQRVKRVIYLYMAGGPSHLETLDFKPKLAQMHGQPMPESFTKGKPIAQLQGQKLSCFAPQHLNQSPPGSGTAASFLVASKGSISALREIPCCM